MTRTANDRTLFHLVPVPGNQAAEGALSHPDNQRFVSLSASGKPGLEIGFHVPPFSHGHVITRLGRNTDLILRESYSAVHVAFETHPETLVVMLSVRTKRASSVSIALSDQAIGQAVSGDCAILYGRGYRITIASYVFKLVWRPTEGSDRVQSLKDLATRGYEDAMQRLKDVRSRDLSIPESSTANSWYMTRLQSAKAPLFTELEGCRVLIGEGGFGKVYRTVDQASGNPFAVKEVNLRQQATVDVEAARTALHREVKIMETVLHAHIIECLGTKDFDTDRPLIFMPLRQGSLHSLIQGRKASNMLCKQVLDQMLRALDYLAFRSYCHRDVKPLNILYQILGQDEYLFQLADFGLANHFRNAKTFCGTELYLAPELYNEQPQTPKMDIWSLFVTMAEIVPDYDFPPKTVASPSHIIQAVQKAAAAGYPQLQPMARTNPMLRASAAQMLATFFDGKGLTTPRRQIPPIEPDVPQPAAIPLNAQAAPPPAPPPVIEYPRRRHQQPFQPAPTPGILPNRPPQRPLVHQPIRAQKDGIRKQAALQARPQARLLQATRGMQAQAKGIQPQALNRRPQEKEPLTIPARTKGVQPLAATKLPQEKGLPVQPKQPETSRLPAPRGAGPARSPVRAPFADSSEITTPHLPGMFPEPWRC
ncbi:kinase-like protein [Nemania abortiva]|nr:kinase-like protein [Nemania abortiva]